MKFKHRAPHRHHHHHRMRIFLIAIAIGCIGVSGVMWYTARERTPPNPIEQKEFIHSILTVAEKNNRIILKQRQHLSALYRRAILQKAPLNYLETVEFHHLLHAYQVSNNNPRNSDTWNELFSRINIVPNSLIISQAIVESAWGRSRFAIQSNNYFGQACFTANCGSIPQKRGHSHREVQFFSGLDTSVESYMRNLNTNPAYADFRAVRHDIQQQHPLITGTDLVGTLGRYSQEHQVYIEHIQEIIHKFNLSKYDTTESTLIPTVK